MRALRTLSVLFLLFLLAAPPSLARRDAFTDQQKQQLKSVNTVLIEVIALTDKGPADTAPFRDLVTKRMSDLGYQTLSDPAQPHDVVFWVKCEQHKVWEGTMASGGDADVPDSPARLWKGPACQLAYFIDGKKMGWRKEVRTDFADAEQAAAAAKADDAGAYAMSKLRERLAEYEFPILITAEWGQEERLFKLYDDPAVSSARKVKVIGALGQMFSTQAVPRLVEGLNSNDLEIAKASALALGNIGQKDSVPGLIRTMN